MVGDRADAMLEVMDEGMHEGKYRRIEVITGHRQRRNWTDEEKARILAESAEPDVNVWRREAGLTSRRSAQAGAQQAMFVPVTVVAERTPPQSASSDITSGRIEIEIAGARMTVFGSVAPELAQAMVAALRGRR